MSTCRHDWTRTLLEHYVLHSLRVQLLPHPSMDTGYVLERLPHIADLGVNLLEFFLQRAVSESIDPHPVFDTRSYLIRHPEAAASRTNPLAHHVMNGGIAWWRGEAEDPRPKPRPRKVAQGERRRPRCASCPPCRLSTEFRDYLEGSEYRVFGAEPRPGAGGSRSTRPICRTARCRSRRKRRSPPCARPGISSC